MYNRRPPDGSKAAPPSPYKTSIDEYLKGRRWRGQDEEEDDDDEEQLGGEKEEEGPDKRGIQNEGHLDEEKLSVYCASRIDMLKFECTKESFETDKG